MVKTIISELKSILDEDSLLIDEPMAKHTSFRVGGPVNLLLPKTEEELSKILQLLSSEKIPFYIMGNGSNLLVSDIGFSGVVIKLCSNLNKVEVADNIINAQSGVLLTKLSKIALRNNLSGLEFASGIPGTLGGAVTMNAGAYGGELKDVLLSVHVMNKQGKSFDLVNGELELGYRTSAIDKQDLIVLSAKIKLIEKDYDSIKALMSQLDAKRKSKQPLEWPSAGSTFKRPEGHYAGKLIEDAGLKGYQIGGAQVSDKHCGFIINTNEATAADIYNLICHIQDTVFNKFGVRLDTEVKKLGEF